MILLTLAISWRIRGGYDDALYKSTFTLLTLLHFTRDDGVDFHCECRILDERRSIAGDRQCRGK